MECGSVFSVLSSTMIFVITVVKMLSPRQTKSTDNTEPFFYHNYSTSKNMFISEWVQDDDTKKEQALSTTFSQ